MARIRSIKPEFWTDGTNLKLSDSCSLFFIGLWNFCDDEGKHKLDLKQLVAELGGRWHQGKVKLFLSCLAKTGQLIVNSDSTWIQVTGWSHQKIDKPRQPDVKFEELQWLSVSESWKALEHSRTIDARIGEDRRERIGSITSEVPTEPKSLVPEVIQINSKVLKKENTEKNRIAKNAYVQAFCARYNQDPIIDMHFHTMIANIVKRVGPEDAAKILEFYVGHNDPFYAKKCHAVRYCLHDLDSLAVQAAKGKQILRSDLKRFEEQTDVVQLTAEDFEQIRAGKTKGLLNGPSHG